MVLFQDSQVISTQWTNREASSYLSSSLSMQLFSFLLLFKLQLPLSPQTVSFIFLTQVWTLHGFFSIPYSGNYLIAVITVYVICFSSPSDQCRSLPYVQFLKKNIVSYAFCIFVSGSKINLVPFCLEAENANSLIETLQRVINFILFQQ